MAISVAAKQHVRSLRAKEDAPNAPIGSLSSPNNVTRHLNHKMAYSPGDQTITVSELFEKPPTRALQHRQPKMPTALSD